MRKELRKLENIRSTFTATFSRFGTKSGWRGEIKTILLKDIKDVNNRVVADHLWFNCTKGFDKMSLSEGDIVKFDARVKEYLKGYCGYREDVYKPVEKDYRLSHPTKIAKIVKNVV